MLFGSAVSEDGEAALPFAADSERDSGEVLTFPLEKSPAAGEELRPAFPAASSGQESANNVAWFLDKPTGDYTYDDLPGQCFRCGAYDHLVVDCLQCQQVAVAAIVAAQQSGVSRSAVPKDGGCR